MDIFSEIEKHEDFNSIFKSKLSEDERNRLISKCESSLGIDEIFESLNIDSEIDDEPVSIMESEITIVDTEQVNSVEIDNTKTESPIIENDEEQYISISNKYLEEVKTPIGSYEISSDQKSVEKHVEALVKKYNSRIPRAFGAGGGVGSQTVREIISNYVADGTLVGSANVEDVTIEIIDDYISNGTLSSSATTVEIIDGYISDGLLLSAMDCEECIPTISATTISIIDDYILDGTLTSATTSPTYDEILVTSGSDSVYAWNDLIGQIIPRDSGGPQPAFVLFRGSNIYEYAFSTNDQVDKITFHIPHDWYSGMDELFIHPHWGHNGTSITGDFVIDWYLSYADGYSQEAFPEPIVLRQTIPTNITSHPQWYHNINDFKIGDQGGTGGILDVGSMETDGLLRVAMKVISVPTISGGLSSAPFIFTIDLHYQSTNLGTRERNAPFL